MKTLFILLFLLLSCKDAPTPSGFVLSGSWKLTEYIGNDGANDYHELVKDGRTLTFKADNILTDNLGNRGSYTVHGDSLKIMLAAKNEHYRFYFYNDDLNTVHLTPVTPDYKLICDEGCAYVYVKQ